MFDWMRTSGIVILVGILVLFLLSLTPIGSEKIFSNVFVDSYAPRKVMIVERNPIRIVLFGEFGDKDHSTKDAQDDDYQDKTNFIVDIITELRKMESLPVYPLNVETSINVNSKLTGDRNRGASKSVVIATPDGSLKEIETENENE